MPNEYIVIETIGMDTESVTPQVILKKEVVSELVRCKDCKFHEYYEGYHTCEWHGFANVKPDWYCADGERKDDGAE